jgi:phosphate/phosphite/phosphonate ABC transporter binding protein
MKKIVVSLVLISLFLPLYFAYSSNSSLISIKPRIQDHKPLMMGVIPYLQPEKLKLQIDPILNYLALKLNRQIKLTTVSDYEGLGRLLELNRIQIALFSDTSYRKLKKDNAWEVLCRPVQYGSVVYRGQIIARKNSEIDSLEKLRGKRFAYVDRYSGSGFFYPNLLLKEKNIAPLDFFSEVFFSQSHRSSILGVLSGQYDGAAVFSANLLEPETEGEETQLKIVARTEPIPNDPLVVRQDLDSDLKNAIANAMLNMHEDESGKKFLATLKKLRGTEKFISEAEVKKIIQQAKNDL